MQSAQNRTMGGYFQLQLANGNEYYPDLVRLNTARNAFGYILETRKYTKVYLPFFTCEVMLEPLFRLNIPYQFYRINKQLEPILDFEIGATECLLYNNYFGLKQNAVERLSHTVRNLIVDNAQAFYSEPLTGIDTFYSCRKFFGVPDGAYLQIDTEKYLELESDISVNRFSHLVKSIDQGIEDSYTDFIQNENGLIGNEIKSMSVLTKAILSNIDYSTCKDKRIENFNFLHENLSSVNELEIDFPLAAPAMLYPFLVSKTGIKEKLIDKKIFVPTYWPNIFKWTTNDMLEYQLAKNVIYLPVDHRYNLHQMSYMLNILEELI